MNRSIKLLEALNDVDEQLLVDYKETTKEKNSHKSYKERVIGMKNLKYALVPACMIMVAVVGYIGVIKTNNNSQNNPIADLTDESKEESLEKTININKIDNMMVADIDIKTEEVSGLYMPYFDYMSNLAIPSDFDTETYYRIFVKSNINANDDEYYEFGYKNSSNNRNIKIAFSDKLKPLRDYEILGENKVSKIGDAELIISQYKSKYIVTFTHKGINFDVETTDITEQELISLLESIIERVNNSIDLDN